MGIKLNHIPDMQESRDYTLDMAINTIVLRKPAKEDRGQKLRMKEPIHRYTAQRYNWPCETCGHRLHTKYHD